jgi:DNA-directed RNA polymerase subunit M/transcription elongation factor TFIIS
MATKTNTTAKSQSKDTKKKASGISNRKKTATKIANNKKKKSTTVSRKKVVRKNNGTHKVQNSKKTQILDNDKLRALDRAAQILDLDANKLLKMLKSSLSSKTKKRLASKMTFEAIDFKNDRVGEVGRAAEILDMDDNKLSEILDTYLTSDDEEFESRIKEKDLAGAWEKKNAYVAMKAKKKSKTTRTKKISAVEVNSSDEETEDDIDWVHRKSIIQEFRKCFRKPKFGELVERGCYNYAFDYCTAKNYDSSMFLTIYLEKANDILGCCQISLVFREQIMAYDFRVESIIPVGKEKEIVGNLRIINPEEVAYLEIQHLDKDRWEPIISQKRLREEKLKNAHISDQYQCRKCHKRKIHVTFLQTRSIDEPVSIFLTCTICGATRRAQ